MKNSRLFVTKSPTHRKIPKPNYLYLLLLVIPCTGYSQFEQLISEAQEFQEHTRTLSNQILGIIKMIAGVAMGISGLTYAYLRDQQSDLTTRLGKTVIGIAIFLALLAVGEEIASL